MFALIGCVYVDDCDLFQVGHTPILVLTSIQSLINSWSSLIEITGGSIRTDKSWWYLVDYVWKRGKWIGCDAEVDVDLVATSSNGEKISLQRLRCDEASEIFGIWLAPNGNTKKCISVLKRKPMDWGSNVRLGNPPASEAWTSLHTNINARLK